MISRSFRACVFFLAALLFIPGTPSPAFASSVTLQGGGGETESAPTDPPTPEATAGVAGSISVADTASIELRAGYTHDFRTPRAMGAQFGTSADDVWLFGIGATWFPDDHWLLTGGFNGSPPNTSRTDTDVSLDTTASGKTSTVTDDALLQTVGSEAGFSFSASYDTAGESNYESTFLLNVAGTELWSSQKLLDLVQDGAVDTTAGLKTYCAGSGKATTECKRIGPALKQQPADLDSLALNLGFSEQLFQDTDVSVGGTYYLYNEDPTQVGYFNVAARGRLQSGVSDATRATAATSFGEGVPVEPFLWTVNVGLAHSFGSFRLAASCTYGQYYDDTGNEIAFGLRASYKFTKHWKVTATAGLSDDTETGSPSLLSPNGTLAVKYTF